MYIYVMNVDYECKYYVVFIYTASLQKVKSLRENLLACKSLLHCKREELKKYWMDGLEYNEVLNLLDRMWAIHNSCGLDLRGGPLLVWILKCPIACHCLWVQQNCRKNFVSHNCVSLPFGPLLLVVYPDRASFPDKLHNHYYTDIIICFL